MKIPYVPTIFFLSVLALAVEAGLLSLAHWQWNRYHQRLALQAEVAARLPVALTGEWLPAHTYALTNQPNPLNPESDLGWRILTPLRTASGTIIVDRGFTHPRFKPNQGPDFASFKPTETSATLTGYLQPFPQRKGWLQGPDVTTHPRLLAYLNPALIISDTQPVYLITRTATSPELTAVPPPLPAPTKHLSYALQWLGMAIAFPILCLLRLRRK
ncbi:MAG: hypothetical protein DI585_00200 [Pseudomonas fluorescens]|nr:MAG: hypothetical protein DI585_00200 [Pseudomonas fluorescens]